MPAGCVRMMSVHWRRYLGVAVVPGSWYGPALTPGGLVAVLKGRPYIGARDDGIVDVVLLGHDVVDESSALFGDDVSRSEPVVVETSAVVEDWAVESFVLCGTTVEASTVETSVVKASVVALSIADLVVVDAELMVDTAVVDGIVVAGLDAKLVVEGAVVEPSVVDVVAKGIGVESEEAIPIEEACEAGLLLPLSLFDPPC